MGKGSKRRPMNITPEQYGENYDKIFNKKKFEKKILTAQEVRPGMVVTYGNSKPMLKINIYSQIKNRVVFVNPLTGICDHIKGDIVCKECKEVVFIASYDSLK